MMTDEQPPQESPQEARDAIAADPVECAAEVLRDEHQGRLWLHRIAGLLQQALPEHRLDGRARFELESMIENACQRASRILRSDLP